MPTLAYHATAATAAANLSKYSEMITNEGNGNSTASVHHVRTIVRSWKSMTCRTSTYFLCFQAGQDKVVHFGSTVNQNVSTMSNWTMRRTLLYHPCHQLPFASVGLGMDFARSTCHNTEHHQLAAGPSQAHIGIGRSLTAPPSHTTQHTTGPYYCAIRLIRQIQIQGNKSSSDTK